MSHCQYSQCAMLSNVTFWSDFQTWCRAIKVYYFDILAITTTTCTVRKTPGLNDSLWHLASSSTFIPKRVILDKGRKVTSHSLFAEASVPLNIALLRYWGLFRVSSVVYVSVYSLINDCILAGFFFFENAHCAKCGYVEYKNLGEFLNCKSWKNFHTFIPRGSHLIYRK